MLYHMKLHEDAFNRVRDRRKTLELRLYDKKRQTMKRGDEIEFSRLPELTEKIRVRVIDLFISKTFADLIEAIPPAYLGYTESDKEYLRTCMYEIYTKEDETKYGVLG